jgi:MFS family permease
MFVASVHIVPHAIELGFSPAMAASVLATMGGLGIAGRIGLGGAADRIGNKQGFIIGFILISGSLLWLVPATEAWKLYLFAVVFGFAFGGLGVVESPLAASLFGLSSHGLIYGVLTVGWTMGASAGPFVAGYIFDVTGSYQVAFLLGAAAGIIGLILTAVLKPIGGGKI